MSEKSRGNFISPKELVMYGFKQNKIQEQTALDQKLKEAEDVSKKNEDRMSIYEAQSARRKLNDKFMAFSGQVKEALLIEAIYSIYDKALDTQPGQDFDRDIKRNYVSQFVIENGASKLLTEFKSSTTLLSELALKITTAHAKIVEAVDRTDASTFSINSEDRDSFLEDIEDEAMDAVANVIRLRVSDAVNTFITDNKEDKEKLNDVVAQFEDKIADLDPEEDSALEESYSMQLKRKANTINNRRTRSIYETMVWSISEAAMKNDDLKAEFCNEGKLDLPKVMHSSVLMYTLLETLGTTKMVNVDSEYVEKVYRELREI